ncbi:cadherin-like protein 26 [Melanotaenia boesemani]|uniref:cadherin-like protein 26 n=1 Tax=Melanotaenia boesemani TaxID=1250792 RepID=UPI001C041317|nr:cadherin-like protein 26 [Melanotaenia boesemani]
MLCFFLLIYYLSTPTCSHLLSRHKRTWIIDSFEIEEGHQGPFPYMLGKVNVERKYQVQFELFGEGVEEEPKGVLSIDRDSGFLYVHRAVDYEEKTVLKLRFEAKKTDLSTDTKLGIEISIRDINDNPPRFERDLYEITVNEDKTQGFHLLTVLAYDKDQRGTSNSTFHYEIKSVSPNVPDTEFFVKESGAVSFKGCLDYEVAKMFTLLVEAKDHGDVVSLSSTTTVIIHVQDGNNHLPIIRGQTGTGKVKENESGSTPLRLHVTDKDTVNSKAWRAKYTIHGDLGGNFKIETDPETNDGILTVVKPLNFEEGAQKELTVSVENEAPYFSCKVEEKTSARGLWKVDTSIGHHPDGAGQPHSIKVMIEVEDTNDPPEFSVAVKEATLGENVPVGTWVERVVAVDPDSNLTRDFIYKVGHDPAGWVTVDPQTGAITTRKSPDRESPHVVDGLYTIILHAVDDREPPLTGTATLQIHIADRNDNAPQPVVDFVDVCVSDAPTTTNITAFDPDGNPFGGPFKFELLGNVEGKWKLNPAYGFTAGLVKEPGVYASSYTIALKISDLQGVYGVYNLSVTVCDCSARPNCHIRQHATTKASYGTLSVVLASLVLFLFLLLMAVVITCKEEFATLQTDDSSGETLLKSNIETPGTDCKVPQVVVATSDKCQNLSIWQKDQYETRNKFSKGMDQSFVRKHFRDYRWNNSSTLFGNNWNQTWSSPVANGHNHSQQFKDMGTENLFNTNNSSGVMDAALRSLLHQRISSLEETEKDLLDYKPHSYKEEGDSDILSELDKLSIPEEESFQKILKDLGPQFNQLAAICQIPKNPQ